MKIARNYTDVFIKQTCIHDEKKYILWFFFFCQCVHKHLYVSFQTHLCQQKSRHKFCLLAFLFVDQLQFVWSGICDFRGKREKKIRNKYKHSWMFRTFKTVYAYGVPTRVKIGSPKYAGTFSSINECVLINVSVASGNTRVSLWQDPGRGSGI